MKKFLLVALSLISFSAIAAKPTGVFIEPMVTYEQGESKVDYPDPIDNSSGDVDGFGLGARIGFHVYESLFLGMDGRYSWPRFKDSSLDQDTNAKAWNYGPVIGVQTPTTIGLRLWAGYILDAEMNPDRDEGVNSRFYDGRGYRVGAGIRLGIASLNLEYQRISYEKTEIQEVGVFNPGYRTNDIELKNDSYVLSVSFPIGL